MKKTKKNKSTAKILIILVVIILVVALAVFLLSKFNIINLDWFKEFWGKIYNFFDNLSLLSFPHD